MKLKFVFLIICLSGFRFNSSDAQNTSLHNQSLQDEKIIWVGEFPKEQNNNDAKFFKKLSDYLFGKKTVFLRKPISILLDNSGVLWVTDQGNKTILNIKNNTFEIPRVLKKSNQELLSLVDISSFQNNSILFTDSYSNSIFILDNDANKLSKLNETLKLNQPTGIAYSQINGEIWVVETAAHRISVLNEKGELIKRIGKRGEEPGNFNFPTFIRIDKFGIIYVVDSMNFRIQIFDKNGKFIALFGEQGDGSGNFARPKGIAVDSHGNIYVADALFHVVQIFDKTGNFLYSFGSQGRNKGQFWMPTGIFIDSKDYIYVADSYNSRIQIFKLNK